MTLYTTLDSPLGELLLVGEESATAQGGTALASLSVPGQKGGATVQDGWTYDPGGLRRDRPPAPRVLRRELDRLRHRVAPSPGHGLPAARVGGPGGRSVRHHDHATGRSPRDIGAARRRVRAVGTAIGANPLLVVRPCHRVIAADGVPAGYAGGPVRKRQLLGIEGVAPDAGEPAVRPRPHPVANRPARSPTGAHHDRHHDHRPHRQAPRPHALPRASASRAATGRRWPTNSTPRLCAHRPPRSARPTSATPSPPCTTSPSGSVDRRHGPAPLRLRHLPLLRTPLPEPVRALREAFYPQLLPIARDWAARLGRPAPWPDTLAEWLAMCHDAGQAKSSQILLRYGAGRLERAAPGHVRGHGLPAPGRHRPGRAGHRLHRRRVPARRSSGPGRSPAGPSTVLPQGHGLIFTTRDRPVALRPRLVGRAGAPRREHRPLGPAALPGPGLP